MAAQKGKKNRKKFFVCLNVYQPKIHLIKALNYLDSSSLNGRLPQDPINGGFKELFLHKNEFKTCAAVNFLKKHLDLETRIPTKDMKFRLEFLFTCPSTYELIIT